MAIYSKKFITNEILMMQKMAI